jgi:hypothetical protein
MRRCSKVVRRLDSDHETLRGVEERAVVRKRRRATGPVRVRAIVPLDRWVETPIPVRQEGDTTIVTLREGALVQRLDALGNRGDAPNS